MTGHGDHDRNIGAQRTLDQIGKALSLTLLPPEPVDYHEVRTAIYGSGDLLAGVQQLAAI
jgi:hypothetical protein